VVHHRCHGGLVFVHDRTELRHGAAIGGLLIRELVFACGLRTRIDARQVVMMLNDLKGNLVERSGGSYEAPAMQGEARDGRAVARATLSALRAISARDRCGSNHPFT
jgi:hypothetical protein